MWREEEWYTSLSDAEKLECYEAGQRFNERLRSYGVSDRLRKFSQSMMSESFLNDRLPLDYKPFTGKIKWHSTGLIDVHGKWKIPGNFNQKVRNVHKKRSLVDPEFYSFDLIKYVYDQGDMTVEEYLDNVRAKAKYIREES